MVDYLKETIETYNNNAQAFEHSRASFAQHSVIEHFCSLISGENILDLGCGPGRDARIFVDKGYTVTGINLSQELLQIAQANVPEATFLLMDMRDLSLPDHQFDGVWASASLLHLKKEDISVVLNNLYRVLKPGGVLYISVKEGNSEEIENDPRLGGGSRFFSYHTAQQMREYIENVGFHIIEINESESHNALRTWNWITLLAKK